MIPQWAHWLRSPESQATVFGDLEWYQMNGSAYGKWDGFVATGDPIRLQIRFSPKRPDNPTVLLQGRDSTWRVDHNGSHQHGAPSTHLQYQGDDDFIVYLDAARVGSPVWGSRLDLSVLRSTMYLSASFLNVDARGARWFDPPEEVL